ncbi:MAG: FAD-dependent oxidoreductase, partial [Proteobacteria bacterium]|nr:FAD-dependent oxidoreductase [Pseudomonadota bacterium]
MDQREKGNIGAVLVVGGGIAGIQASLDLANSGIKVYLLEKGAAIGGRMAQLDKTFPTNDCAMCIISPKLVEAGRHLNIDILTNSELLSLSGFPGRFTARLRRRPRYVDISKCTGCADCVEACPIGLSNEFNEGLDERKAIYRPYPQAVPNSFLVTKRGTSPCKATCPAETSAQGYVALIREGRYEEALEVIKEYNPFPASVGRVCTHPCEVECTRGKVDSPVAICALKRFAADWVYEHGSSSDKPIGTGDGITDRPAARIAVVGSGPAGLSCAHQLVRMGYGVTVFESLPAAGGMMRVGIPAYRLPREVLQREIEAIVAEGVEIRLNTPVRDINGLFAEGYAAVFLAIGAHEAQRLGIEGEDALGVYHGVPFLQAVSLAGAGDALPTVGERVAVIGGGNTAVDAARTALRLGAREVVMVYRRSREEMPANDWEIEEAEREGVKLELLTAPVAVETAHGRIAAIRCQRMELGEPDASGRRRPVPVAGSEFVIAADTMIAAVAQAPEISFLDAGHGLEVSSRGTFVVDGRTLATRRAGVFAGGDAHRGPGILIEAIADGRRGALSIDRYLRGVDLFTAREEVPLPVVDLSEEEIGRIVASGEVDLSPRAVMSTVPVAERLRDFREVELSLTEEEARREAARCLECGICSECHLCVRVCKAGAIDHQEAFREEEIEVGSVILAPGYSLYDPALSPELGYGRYPNVVTSMEFERMLSATGPFGGHLKRPSDHGEPKKIAFLQCVGSRDKTNDYCSSVCCMYATKEAMLAKEHIPDAECTVFQMDMRAFGKGFDAYYERGKGRGINYVSCRISALEEDPLTKDIIIRYRNGGADHAVHEERIDLAILSVGICSPGQAGELAGVLGVELNRWGFCSTQDFHPLETNRPGVYVCGSFAEPKDIPDSVIQAGGAAAKALALLGDARGTLVRAKEYPPEREIPAGEEPRIGVFVCSCGSNIAATVDVKALVEHALALPHVVHAENTIYTCSTDSLKTIQNRLQELNLNRLVVSSCSPRTHEPLFQETIREAGLNKYLFEMANIRDQCSWVHMGEREAATEKAKHLMAMAVACVARLEPLHRTERGLVKKCLVVGGGLAGMTSALNLARQGFPVTLVEREKQLGGLLRRRYFSAEGGDPQQLLRDLVSQVAAHPLIDVLCGYEAAKHSGAMGNFQTTLAETGGPRQAVIEHGTTIIASGGREYRGRARLQGDDGRVITQEEMEERLFARHPSVMEAGSLVMIQCAGPWDDDPTVPFYCSRVCCAAALKNALKAKELNPEIAVVVLFRDMRTYGFKESLYTEAREKGIVFIRFDDRNRPLVSSVDGRLQVEIEEPVLRLPLVLQPDMLVLSQAVVPPEGSRELANVFKFPLSADGFFLEAHLKLRPVDFASDGLYLCGLAHYPKTINETIAQAEAAAARAAGILSRNSLLVGGIVAVVDGERCAACLTCVRVCPYEVPVVNVRGEAEIDIVKCKGCGSCAAECPARAIDLMHFTTGQLEAKVG